MNRRRGRPAVWPLDVVLSREGLTDPGDDPGALDALARALDGCSLSAKEYAATVAEHADAVRTRAYRIRREAARAASFAGKIERGEVCPVVWKNPPKDRHDEARVIGIAAGSFVIEGIAGSHYPRSYTLRTGRPGYPYSGTLEQVDTVATLTLWRAFCERRREVAP